ASRKDLDLGPQGRRRTAPVPPTPDRPLRTVACHDAALNPKPVLAKPHRAGSDGLCSNVHAGHLNDGLVAVLFELALAERGHRSRQFGFRHTCTATAPGRISASQRLDGRTDLSELPPNESTEESGRFQLARDPLDRLLDVLRLARPRADELAAAEQEADDLRVVERIDQPGELLRLILGPAEDASDRLEVEFLPEGSRSDDVFDLDFRQRHTTEGRKRRSGAPASTGRR